MSEQLYIVAAMDGGSGAPAPGATITDSDLWGLDCAVQPVLDSGYLSDNPEWALAMLARIGRLRGMEE